MWFFPSTSGGTCYLRSFLERMTVMTPQTRPREQRISPNSPTGCLKQSSESTSHSDLPISRLQIHYLPASFPHETHCSRNPAATLKPASPSLKHSNIGNDQSTNGRRSRLNVSVI